jgi:hypothetical protein
VPLNKTIVNVILSFTNDPLVMAKIDDLHPNFKQHTEYIQTDTEWEFKRVDVIPMDNLK